MEFNVILSAILRQWTLWWYFWHNYDCWLDLKSVNWNVVLLDGLVFRTSSVWTHFIGRIRVRWRIGSQQFKVSDVDRIWGQRLSGHVWVPRCTSNFEKRGHCQWNLEQEMEHGHNTLKKRRCGTMILLFVLVDIQAESFYQNKLSACLYTGGWRQSAQAVYSHDSANRWETDSFG